MSNKTIEKVQAQLNQLVTNCPELEQNSQWKELWANLEELAQVVSRQNLILETAADVSNAASTIFDVGEFLAFATNLIRTNFDFHEVGIFLIDESHKWLELKATTTLTDTPFQPRVSLEEETTISRAIYQQKPFISIDANVTRQPAPATLRILTIPLISRGQTIGALVIQASKEYDLSKENIKAFQALADQLSNSIQNSLLFATTDRQLGQLITLHNINLQIGNHFDLYMLLQEVAQLSVKLLGADACIIRLLNEDQTEFEVKTTHNLPEINQPEDFNTGLSHRVLETGQAVLVNSWNDDPLALTYKELPAVPNAVLGAPITLPQKFLGVIEVYSFSNRQAFDESDLYTLSLLASQTAAAIDNTRLFNKAENSYRFLETVIEHIPDPIFIKDKRHTWMAMNQANANVIGQPKYNLIGKTDKDFFAQELAEEFYRRDDEVLSTNQVAEFEDKTIWADGQEHTAYTRLIPIIDPAIQQSEYLLGITHDITQRKAQEAEREHFLAETAALYKGSQSIANALSERQIYEALFEQIRLEDPCEIAAFSFEAVNNELIWAELKSSWQRQDNPTYPPETKIYLPDAPYSRLLTTTEPVFIPDLASDPRLSDSEREAFAPSQAKSLAILPLLTSGQELGYIIVFFTQPYSFPEVTQRFWAAMIDQAGIALSNRRLIQEAAYRVIKMETAAEVAQAASSILDLNNLLNSAVNLIRDRFDLYYVGAFLVDAGNTWAVLRAGTGEAGKIQLKKNHRLKIGGDSMIGWSVKHRQPRIALDVGQEAVHFQNPDLPDTRSEMALPLIYRNRAIGALTVQSTEQAAFSREDIIFLQTMANQLANAIENARLFEHAQQEIAERKNAENRIHQLLSEAQHHSTLLQTAAEVSRGASSILDVDDLINKSVNLIRDKFDFYYVGLFLVDNTSGYAVLRAGTGEAGQIQLKNKHSLEIGGESMIGWCIEHHKAKIALDVGEEAVHFKNPILPNTHSEMALPLISRDQVIGALTVQSTERGAFSDDDITLLQTMADQLANALTNAYLFENVAQARKEAESRLKETEALQKLSQNLAGTLAVDEILAIFFEACTQEIGFEYAQFSLVDKEQNRVKAIGGVGLPDSQIKRSNHSLNSNDIMANIIRTGKTEIISGWDDRFDKEIFEAEGHTNWVRIFTPITLRQENIGLVEAGFNKHVHIKIQDTQIRLLQAFISQTALALDNAQRYEASQRAARREALIKEITTKVRASTDLDDILKTTVQEVGHAISNKRTYIQLVSPNKTNSKTNGNTDHPA